MEKKLFYWRDKFSVGVEEIDNQHKKLIDLINELYNAYITKRHADILSDVLDELINYTVYHFDTEEKYFEKFNYSFTDDHIAEHNSFKKKALELKKKFGKHTGVLSSETLLFLQNWISTHILKSDQKYVSCFKEAGL